MSQPASEENKAPAVRVAPLDPFDGAHTDVMTMVAWVESIPQRNGAAALSQVEMDALWNVEWCLKQYELVMNDVDLSELGWAPGRTLAQVFGFSRAPTTSQVALDGRREAAMAMLETMADEDTRFGRWCRMALAVGRAYDHLHKSAFKKRRTPFVAQVPPKDAPWRVEESDDEGTCAFCGDRGAEYGTGLCADCETGQLPDMR